MALLQFLRNPGVTASGDTTVPTYYETGFTVDCRQPAGTWLTLDATKYTMVLSGTTKIRLTLTGTVATWQASHELRVSYNSAVGNIKDLAGNALASFTNNATLTNSSTIDLLATLTERYSLNEASGTRVASITTPGNDLTDNNTVLQGTGKLGNAADFEKDNTEYLSLADNAAMSTGDIDFAVATWANLESKTADMFLVAKWNATGNNREYAIYYDSAADRFIFYVYSDGDSNVSVTASTFGSPSTATWYRIMAGHDSVNNLIFIQVNAGTRDTTATSTGVKDGTGAFLIGEGLGFSRPYDGLQDEVLFWKKVPSTAEATDDYNGATGKAWPFVPDSS